jgi:hypothetical protein
MKHITVKEKELLDPLLDVVLKTMYSRELKSCITSFITLLLKRKDDLFKQGFRSEVFDVYTSTDSQSLKFFIMRHQRYLSKPKKLCGIYNYALNSLICP